MALLVVFVCLMVQRVLAWDVPKPSFPWFIAYTRRLEGACVNVSWWQGMGGVLLLWGSIAAAYLLVIGLLEHFLGPIFTFAFHLVVLWYYLDAKPLNVAITDNFSVTDLFTHRYQNIFVLLFWYMLVGPLGVILYAESARLEQYLQQQQKQEVYFAEDFLKALSVLRNLMDWVPVRLLGLSFALAGQFRPVFTFWCSHLAEASASTALVAEYGQLALGWDASTVLTPETMDESEALINRTIILWIVALALVILGRYL